MTVSDERGCVYVVATPIGNLEDLTPRALEVLRAASVIACEDTRHTGRLCQHYDVATRRVSLHAHNEAKRVPELLERLARGDDVALVSDAGTPLLSDPGGLLVRAAIEQGIRVVPIPGASAILSALVASGLATRPFTFVGFLPRKGGGRSDWLEQLARLPGTIVLFEAPNRLEGTLADLHASLGPRDVVIARELTKRYEELVRGTLGEVGLEELRGEVTLVIGPGDPIPAQEPVDVDALARALLAEGLSTRDAAARLVERTRLSKNAAYQKMLDLSRGT